MRPPLERPVAEIAALVAAGELSGGELLRASERALQQADAGPDPVHALLSARFHLPDSPPATGRLAGVPLVVKDNLCTVDFPTTCGSRILQGYRSPFDATAVRRLREHGAVLVGKANLDEFAMGSSTEYSAFGPTRNPAARDRVPGGSSGGSAAAVAAGIVPAALGSETGGSVRQPAAFCGVVGLQPTYGRVSRYGLVAFASSLDQIGILARGVADAALLLQCIAGHDPLDSTSARRPVPELLGELEGGVGGLVIGVPEEYLAHGIDRGVAERCRGALRRLEALGAEIREVSLPHTPLALPAYHVLASAEASSNLARFDGLRFGPRAVAAESVDDIVDRTRTLFGPEVKRRVLLGTLVLSAGDTGAHYARAQRARALVAEDFDLVFRSGVDLLFTPTTPTPAFRLGERIADPSAMHMADALTVPASLAGLPALSLPIGRADGLPVGGQFVARAWDEAVLLRAAAALERDLGGEAAA